MHPAVSRLHEVSKCIHHLRKPPSLLSLTSLCLFLSRSPPIFLSFSPISLSFPLSRNQSPINNIHHTFNFRKALKSNEKSRLWADKKDVKLIDIFTLIRAPGKTNIQIPSCLDLGKALESFNKYDLNQSHRVNALSSYDSCIFFQFAWNIWVLPRISYTFVIIFYLLTKTHNPQVLRIKIQAGII